MMKPPTSQRLAHWTLFLALLLLLLSLAHAVVPPGRTAIRINVDPPAAYSSDSAYTPGAHGGSGHTNSPYSYDYDDPYDYDRAARSSSSSRWSDSLTPPRLHRQPNPPLPPPFIPPLHTHTHDASSVGTQAATTVETETEATAATVSTTAIVASTDKDGDHSAAAAGDTEGAVEPTDDGVDSTEPSIQQEPTPPPAPSPSYPPEATAWLSLNGSCFLTTTASYVYSWCPYHNVTQRGIGSHLYVVLGVWDRWQMDARNGRLAAVFTDGTACGSGKRRSTKVDFRCTEEEEAEEMEAESITSPRAQVDAQAVPLTESSDDASAAASPSSSAAAATDSHSGGTRATDAPAVGSYLSDVDEPRMCEYSVRFHTPIVCAWQKAQLAQRGSSGRSTLAALADQSRMQAMQACIRLLYQALQLQQQAATPASTAIPATIEQHCAGFVRGAGQTEAAAEQGATTQPLHSSSDESTAAAHTGAEHDESTAARTIPVRLAHTAQRASGHGDDE